MRISLAEVVREHNRGRHSVKLVRRFHPIHALVYSFVLTKLGRYTRVASGSFFKSREAYLLQMEELKRFGMYE